MKDLNEHQLKVLQQISINAATVVLGTLILGRFLTAAEGFDLTPFVTGIMIYGGLILVTLKIAAKGGG